MFRRFVRTPLALIAALPLALALQSRAHGEDPALEVYYTKLEPKAQFKYKYKDTDGNVVEATSPAGVFRWELPQSGPGRSGLDQNFTGYCAEVLVRIAPEKTYRFRTNNIDAAENYNLSGAAKTKFGAAANRRTRLIQELFGRSFRDPLLKAVSADEAIGFQIALWEIIQESEPAEGEPKLDLFAGDFQANYPKADAPSYVLKAQEYLDALTGRDEALFEQNPDLRGRELIRLKGLENVEGVLAQSQFALRTKSGGGEAGSAFSRALVAGGAPGGGGSGGGGSGGGGPGGGLGGGLSNPVIPGNGQSFANNPLNGNGQTFPETGVTPPQPNTFTRLPVGGPSNTGMTFPPSGEPNNPESPNPVPAPAGLLLGAIAVGTIGTWRVIAKRSAAK